VDDHPALRAGLHSLLSGEPGMQVQDVVASGEEAYASYRAAAPDVVILDVSMPGFGGLESLRRIRQWDPAARILVYTVHSSLAMLTRALAQGALGYVTKGSDVDILIQGIREVAARRGFVSPDLIPALVQHQVNSGQPFVGQLSHREFQVLLLTVQGQSPPACAEILHLSEKMVRNHLTRIKAKLGVADTAALVRLAMGAGLVDS
jgi:DNA-binding NarL/FixJ family response regulator